MTTPPPPGDPNFQPPQGQQPQYPGGQQQGYYPPQQPPKKRKTWLWVLLGFFVIIILGFVGCTALVGGAVKSVSDESERVVSVLYEVSGSGSASAITYTTQDVNVVQETDASLPWSKSVDISGLGKYVSLTASNSGDGGEITCSVKVDGKVIITNTGSGPYASASCSGSVSEQE